MKNVTKTAPQTIDPIVLTEKQAAQKLQVSSRTLWTMRQEGLIPFIKLRGLVRYTTEDLDAFVARSRVTAG